MSDLIINAGAFNLATQALRRASKDEIAEQLEKDCECLPDLVKQQQQRIAELEHQLNKYNNSDLVWFERHEIKGLDREQEGVIDLNGLRREAFVEGAKWGVRKPLDLTGTGYVDSCAIGEAYERYPDKEQ